MLLLHTLGFAILIFLPGAWIAFSLPLDDLSFWIRLFIGIMLAPLVVALQFFLMRLVGIPFEFAVVLLVVVNLPAMYLILKRRPRLSIPDQRALWAAGIVAIVILASIAPFLLNPQERQYSWEAWSQADVVYAFANGSLIPEDAELAGVRLSYPWVGHIYQAVLSYSLGTPPVTNYIWANLIWLVGIFGFAAAIVAELGGNQLSQVTAAIWLSFGVNFVGYYVGGMIPSTWIKAHSFFGGIWGDNRYTPWLDKILFFGQMYFAMGLFVAIVYLMIKAWPTEVFRRSCLIVTSLLLCGLGLIYPVLLPPAFAVVGLRGILVLVERRHCQWRVLLIELLQFAITMALPAAVTLIYVRFLTLDRAGDAALISLHDLRFMAQRAIESVIVTSPLLIGFSLVVRKCWKENRTGLVILSLGALVSCGLYILFDIPWYRNEYKFIFTAAICLAPFASLAGEPLLNRLGRLAMPLLAAITLLLSSPLAYHVYANAYTMYTREGPRVDVAHFDLRLDDREALSGLVDAIRLKTPTNSLLIIETTDLHLPTLTRRQLYVAPPQKEPYPGILVSSDETLTLVKDYPPGLLTTRRLTLSELFRSGDSSTVGRALHQMLSLNRPLALVLQKEVPSPLGDWLSQQGMGTHLYEDSDFILWLIVPEARMLP